MPLSSFLTPLLTPLLTPTSPDTASFPTPSFPSESRCLCLAGLESEPLLPLYTECAEDRDELAASLRAARIGRPLMPHPPLHAGPLMREHGSLHWGDVWVVLLPCQLLLLRSAASDRPFRALPLRGATCYHRGPASLIFAVRADGWQVNFAARDQQTRARWLEAMASAVPVGSRPRTWRTPTPCTFP